MISGLIYGNRPVIILTVAGNLSVQNVQATIDTGFTGDVKISPEVATELGLKVTHIENVKVADGRSVAMSSSIAVVDMERIVKAVNVLIMPGEALVGIGFFKQFGYKLVVDCPKDTWLLER